MAWGEEGVGQNLRLFTAHLFTSWILQRFFSCALATYNCSLKYSGFLDSRIGLFLQKNCLNHSDTIIKFLLVEPRLMGGNNSSTHLVYA